MDAKVDVRKLQLLNDRIAQVTDALNQVRLSVHGLAPTGAIGQPIPGLPLGLVPPQLGFQQQVPFGAGPIGYGAGPIGFQHTPYYPGTLGTVPFGPLAWQTGLQSPLAGGYGLQHAGYNPGWFPFFGGGLLHSPPIDLMEQRLIEQRAYDPNRILQTFPFCLAPLSSMTAW